MGRSKRKLNANPQSTRQGSKTGEVLRVATQSSTEAEAVAKRALITLPKHVTQVSLDLTAVNRELSCKICDGYYRDAHTIRECLHTFCKSCLYKRIDEGINTCPTCLQDLGVQPFEAIQYDRSKQAIVSKLFPQLDKTDLKYEEEYYESRGFKKRPDFNYTERAKNRSVPPHLFPQISHVGAQLSAEYIRFSLVPSNTLPSTSEREAEDREDFELPALTTPLLNTSGKVKVIQLKKYLTKVFDLEHRNEVNIMCKNTNLGDELSLFYIRRTLWYGHRDNLVLNYHRNAEYDIEYDERSNK